MKSFDEDGKLIIPDKELHKHGLYKKENKIHINHAFCPKGHELIIPNNEIIDGFPSIKLWPAGTALCQAKRRHQQDQEELSNDDLFRLAIRHEFLPAHQHGGMTAQF